MDQLIAICCEIDDFCKAFEPVYARRLLHVGQRQRTRQTTLALSEILTLLVYFHWSHYRTFKHDYTAYVMAHLYPYFPQLVGYHRFVERMPRALGPLCCDLSTRKGRGTGIAFIDSTPLAVCDNHRIATHKVFASQAHLTSRPFREAAFTRNVRAIYNFTCAMTGLNIINGGGRPEVEAAHIRPIGNNHHGPDSVRNGIALSRSIHWMFDRGLL